MKSKGIAVLGLFLYLMMAMIGEAFSYPDKPIKVVVGYEAGSAGDIHTRAIFKIMEQDLGQLIMIVNKPGASSSMAMREIMDTKPDGYTIGVSGSVNIFKLLGLMPADHHDFDILAVPSVSVAAVSVPAKSPFKTINDLVAYAKANPGKLRCSTTSVGGVHWMQAKYFERKAGIKLSMIVNPGGASFVATQVGGGHADLGVAAITGLRIQRDAGNLRFLGVMADERVPNFEDVPTLNECGIDAVLLGWQCFLAPKGIPKEAYDRLTSAFVKAAASKEYKEWTTRNGRIAKPKNIGEAAVKFLDEDAEIQRPILAEIRDLEKKK